MFSIIVPVAPTFSHIDAITAIESLLRVTTPDDTIILVAEMELINAVNSAEMEKKNQLKFIRHPKIRTAGAARNVALDVVSSAFVIFVDIDDVIMPHHIDVLKRHLINGYCIVTAAIKLSYTSVTRIPEGGRKRFYFRTNIFLPASGYAFSKYPDVRFPQDLDLGEDTVFFARLMSKGAKVLRLKTPGIVYAVDSEKVDAKSGILGVTKEYRYRHVLYQEATHFSHKILVLLGLISTSFVKLMPFTSHIYFSRLLNKHEN